MNVSRETQGRLDHYADLVRKWNPKINLVSRSSLEHLESRHFADSAQLLELDLGGAHWVDLGSGGGFPGLVLACLTADNPDRRYTLVESDQRKGAFLRTVVREIGLNATVKSERIEHIAPLEADILSARALASLPDLLGFAERHLKPGGTAVFPKGATHAQELRDALETHRFHVQTHASRTEPEAVIFEIKDIARVEA